MPTYENEFSNFPSQKITLHKFKNVDDTIAPVVNQINALREKGLYDLAQDTIEANADILAQHIIDATTIRTLEEEIFNTQTYAKEYVGKQTSSSLQCVYTSSDEPVGANINDVWIGGT